MIDLELMEQLLNEAKTQAERLKMMAAEEELSPQQVMEELHDTVMSLVGDMAAATFNALVGIHQYLHDEVEPILVDAAGAADPDDPSQLMPEDADELLVLLNTYKASLVAGLEVQQKSDMSAEEKEAFAKEVAPQIERVSAAIERVEELRLEVSDDDDDDADDDDDPDETPEESDGADTVVPPGEPTEAPSTE